MLNKIKNKAQEEMVGFGIIIIIVAVVLLVFLSFSLKNNGGEDVEDYEVNSFIQSILPFTTNCSQGYETAYQTIEKLIIDCARKERCLGGKDTCDVLNYTLTGIIKESWKVEGDTPVKAYDMKINSNNKLILELGKGNITNNYKSSVQELGRENIQISLNVYYN